MTNLCRLALPHTLIKFGSQLVAPASLNERHWMSPREIHYDSEKAMWIERIILLLRAGIAGEALLKIIEGFAPSIPGQWAKDIRNSHFFLKWGAYSGVALEPDWKSRERKQIDLWFRQRQIDLLLGKG